MKKFILIVALAVLPLGAVGASTDYFLKLDGVDGEVKAPSTSTTAGASGALLVTAKGVVGAAFVLDGTRSVDDGVVAKFSWRQVGGPVVQLANAATLKPSFTPSAAGTYAFELQVADANGRFATVQRSEFVVGNDVPQTGTVTPSPQGAGTGSSSGTKGKVEYEWKVEEGESAAPKPSIEPDEIDVADDGEPVTPDFGILLGGGGGSDDAEAEAGRARAADILLQGMQEAGVPTESVSLNFEKITTKMRQPVKLLGIFPVSAAVTVEVDAEARVRVRFPWWAFLASGKEGDALGERVMTTLSNVLKTKHDTVKNAISNVR